MNVSDDGRSNLATDNTPFGVANASVGGPRCDLEVLWSARPLSCGIEVRDGTPSRRDTPVVDVLPTGPRVVSMYTKPPLTHNTEHREKRLDLTHVHVYINITQHTSQK